MFIQTWGEVFSSSLQNLWYGFISFVPNLLVAIIIFIVGWVVADVIAKAIDKIMQSLKVDKVFQSAGADEMLGRAGIKLNVGHFLGEVVRWFILAVFLMTSLEILGLNQVNDFLREVVLSYLPQVVIAALILVLAAIIANAIGRVVASSAKAAHMPRANMVATVARYAVWIFAFIIALSQLGVAPQFMQILFTGLVAMLTIAGGLAFGLGGRDAAARAIDKMSGDMKNND
ncbi:MAG: hypothetical protein MUD00_00260 [Candidatus Pacebacteria bacterium]|jgi:hypothetical protein|nr:hypothetical protein [Candidatus Paceibacterota bacterium]